jgi:hypothetical protein
MAQAHTGSSAHCSQPTQIGNGGRCDEIAVRLSAETRTPSTNEAVKAIILVLANTIGDGHVEQKVTSSNKLATPADRPNKCR